MLVHVVNVMIFSWLAHVNVYSSLLDPCDQS